MSTTSKVLVSSSTALTIFRNYSNRPAANRCSLKAYTVRRRADGIRR